MSFHEKLIDSVHRYEPLYDTRSQDYYNKPLKEKYWAKIAEEMNLSVDQAQNKWKAMRDKYNRQKKKLKFLEDSGAGEHEYACAKWSLMDRMAFLDGCTSGKRGVSRHATPAYDDGASDIHDRDLVGMATGDSLEVDDLELLAENDSISFELGCASTSAIIERASETRDTGPYSCSSVSTPQPTLLGSHSTRSMDKIPLLKKRKIAHDNLMTKMILNVDKDFDPDRMFLASLAPRMKNLTPKKLSQFKMTILSTLHQLEFDED